MLKQPTFLFWTFSMHQMIFLFCITLYFPKSNGYGQNCYITGNDGSSVLSQLRNYVLRDFGAKFANSNVKAAETNQEKHWKKLRDDGQEVREKDDIKGEMKVHFFLDHNSLNYLVAPPCLRVETNDIFYASIVVHEQKLTGKGTFSF